jgi:hypothetical protein
MERTHYAASLTGQARRRTSGGQYSR